MSNIDEIVEREYQFAIPTTVTGKEMFFSKDELRALLEEAVEAERKDAYSRQEFWWLIETTDGSAPLYATGEPTDQSTWIGQWTRNVHDAMRFKTHRAAERVMLHLSLHLPDCNEGYRSSSVCPVEHCFIDAAIAAAEENL
jgi:hypothetical protein